MPSFGVLVEPVHPLRDDRPIVLRLREHGVARRRLYNRLCEPVNEPVQRIVEDAVRPLREIQELWTAGEPVTPQLLELLLDRLAQLADARQQAAIELSQRRLRVARRLGQEVQQP